MIHIAFTYAAYSHELAQPFPPVKPQSQPRIWRDTQIDRWSMEESGAKEDKAFQEHAVVDAHWRWHDHLTMVRSHACQAEKCPVVEIGLG